MICDWCGWNLRQNAEVSIGNFNRIDMGSGPLKTTHRLCEDCGFAYLRGQLPFFTFWDRCSPSRRRAAYEAVTSKAKGIARRISGEAEWRGGEMLALERIYRQRFYWRADWMRAATLSALREG